jgi:hypothetical protein
MLLQQPNNAYATPSRVLKSDYERVFNENHNRDMFVVCMVIQRHTDKYLSGRGDDLKDVKSIIRYYVSMAIACYLLKKAAAPTDKELAAILQVAVKPLDATLLEDSAKLVLAAYKKHGGTETIAKGPDMRETILKELKAKLAAPGELGL